jgi:large subunit ribosomal protein L4
MNDEVKTMATAKLYSSHGEPKGTVDLPAALFAQPVHRQALYEAVRCYLANQRQGTHDTKTRAEVVGSKSKMYRQKGTGRARMGQIASPSRVGGGRAHGPHPRDYGYKLPRKIKRLALKSALSDRAAGERVMVVEDIEMSAPKTRAMAALLAKLELDGRHTLFVLPAGGDTLFKSLRNLAGVRVLRSDELNAYSILWADHLVFTEAALRGAEEVFA